MPADNEKSRTILCRLCGTAFRATGPHYPKYCSESCRTRVNTAQHRVYVQRNRHHVNEYRRIRNHAVWGRSNREIAARAEEFAFTTLLPGLGFTELYDVTKFRRFVPFDFVATYRGERVLVDVTTGVTKSGPNLKSANRLATALRMKLFLVFIKPDFSAYYVRDASEGGCMILKELRPIAQPKV